MSEAVLNIEFPGLRGCRAVVGKEEVNINGQFVCT